MKITKDQMKFGAISLAGIIVMSLTAYIIVQVIGMGIMFYGIYGMIDKPPIVSEKYNRPTAYTKEQIEKDKEDVIDYGELKK